MFDGPMRVVDSDPCGALKDTLVATVDELHQQLKPSEGTMVDVEPVSREERTDSDSQLSESELLACGLTEEELKELQLDVAMPIIPQSQHAL